MSKTNQFFNFEINENNTDWVNYNSNYIGLFKDLNENIIIKNIQKVKRNEYEDILRKSIRSYYKTYYDLDLYEYDTTKYNKWDNVDKVLSIRNKYQPFDYVFSDTDIRNMITYIDLIIRHNYSINNNQFCYSDRTLMKYENNFNLNFNELLQTLNNSDYRIIMNGEKSLKSYLERSRRSERQIYWMKYLGRNWKNKYDSGKVLGKRLRFRKIVGVGRIKLFIKSFLILYNNRRKESNESEMCSERFTYGIQIYNNNTFDVSVWSKDYIRLKYVYLLKPINEYVNYLGLVNKLKIINSDNKTSDEKLNILYDSKEEIKNSINELKLKFNNDKKQIEEFGIGNLVLKYYTNKRYLVNENRIGELSYKFSGYNDNYRLFIYEQNGMKLIKDKPIYNNIEKRLIYSTVLNY